MKQAWTIQDILSSPVAGLNQHLIEDKPVKKKRERKPSKQKPWIELRLQEFAYNRGVKLEPEFKFHPERRWRFDWAIPELMLAWEYNGLFSAKSRHTTASGYTGDMEKLNAAQALGWNVQQYTAINYLDLAIDLKNL